MTTVFTHTILIIFPNGRRRRSRHVGPHDKFNRGWRALLHNTDIWMGDAHYMIGNNILRHIKPVGAC